MFNVPYRLTTSIECKVMSILTSMLKYSVMSDVIISLRRISIEIKGLFSTRRGS